MSYNNSNNNSNYNNKNNNSNNMARQTDTYTQMLSIIFYFFQYDLCDMCKYNFRLHDFLFCFSFFNKNEYTTN